MRRSYWKNKKEVSPLDVMNRRLLAAEIISALENNGFSAPSLKQTTVIILKLCMQNHLYLEAGALLQCILLVIK